MPPLHAPGHPVSRPPPGLTLQDLLSSGLGPLLSQLRKQHAHPALRRAAKQLGRHWKRTLAPRVAPTSSGPAAFPGAVSVAAAREAGSRRFSGGGAGASAAAGTHEQQPEPAVRCAGVSEARGPKGLSGVRGVNWHKASGKWTARRRLDGKQVHLGSFGDKEAAAKAIAAFVSDHTLEQPQTSRAPAPLLPLPQLVQLVSQVGRPLARTIAPRERRRLARMPFRTFVPAAPVATVARARGPDDAPPPQPDLAADATRDEDCPICLEPRSTAQQQWVALSCGHGLHGYVSPPGASVLIPHSPTS